ncbi:hematopoietic SH2 domain-containing protein isoform X2 [Ascaphus truei]
MQANKPSLKWFIETQSEWFLHNGIPDWFHGVITRKDAEDLLKDKPAGCFLIRVSESRIGYSLSYRAVDRYRHFMIDVLNKQEYLLTGDTKIYKTLEDLVMFHRLNPVHPYNEILTEPCGQKTISGTDYEELFMHRNVNNNFTDMRSKITCGRSNLALPIPEPVQNRGTVHPPRIILEQECPPIPPRRMKPSDCLTEKSDISSSPFQTQMGNRLYPSLSQEFPLMLLSNGTVPVILNQNIQSNTLLKSNSVDSLLLRHTEGNPGVSATANQYVQPNENRVWGNSRQENISPKKEQQFKTHHMLMNKAVSFVPDRQIAHDFKTTDHAVATRIKSVKENSNSVNTKPDGHAHRIVSMVDTKKKTDKRTPEEYKTPPPFAPGFC